MRSSLKSLIGGGKSYYAAIKPLRLERGTFGNTAITSAAEVGLRLRLHRLAEAEIREAAEWYEARGDRLGQRFLADVRPALERPESDLLQYASDSNAFCSTNFHT
jgi:hypothetical protein